MIGAARPPPIMLAMNPVSSSGNADQCSPRRSSKRFTVDEHPDGAVGAEEEADAPEATGRLGDERTAVDELGRSRPRRHRREQPVEPMALQLRPRVAFGVDDQERTLPVEQHGRALGGAQVGGVLEAQPRRFAKRLGEDDAVRELLRLDAGAAELDEVLDRVGDEPGRGRRRRRRARTGRAVR